MRNYNYRMGRRFCSHCFKRFGKEQFERTRSYCPLCHRKLRARPRNTKRVKELIDYQGRIIRRY